MIFRGRARVVGAHLVPRGFRRVSTISILLSGADVSCLSFSRKWANVACLSSTPLIFDDVIWPIADRGGDFLRHLWLKSITVQKYSSLRQVSYTRFSNECVSHDWNFAELHPTKYFLTGALSGSIQFTRNYSDCVARTDDRVVAGANIRAVGKTNERCDGRRACFAEEIADGDFARRVQSAEDFLKSIKDIREWGRDRD